MCYNKLYLIKKSNNKKFTYNSLAFREEINERIKNHM